MFVSEPESSERHQHQVAPGRSVPHTRAHTEMGYNLELGTNGQINGNHGNLSLYLRYMGRGLEGLTSPDFGEVNPNVGLAKLLRLGVIITSESVMLGADAG